MELASKDLCCGCSACFVSCPVNAINIEMDDDNFLYPSVNMSKCIECGKCQNVCPIISRKEITLKHHNKEVIQGFIKNDKKHKASASGGAATAFAENIIKRHGCVFGTIYSDDYRKAKYIKVNQEIDLNKLKGSKYFEIFKREIFKEVKNEVKDGRLVLFIGLPCDIGGLKYYLGKEYDNLYTCELICHGITSQKIQEEYIDFLEKKQKSRVINFNSRYNVEGEEKSFIKVDFENGNSIVKPLWETPYGYAFSNYSRKSCYNCKFKGDSRLADISIGDSWSVRNDFGDKKGVSIIYAHSKKGLDILCELKNNREFAYEQLVYDSIKYDNPAIYESLNNIQSRNKFAQLFNEKGLIKVNIKHRKIIDRIKFVIKDKVKNR